MIALLCIRLHAAAGDATGHGLAMMLRLARGLVASVAPPVYRDFNNPPLPVSGCSHPNTTCYAYTGLPIGAASSTCGRNQRVVTDFPTALPLIWALCIILRVQETDSQILI